MDFQGLHDRLLAINAPGLVGTDEPRKPNPKDKKDKGRAGDPFVIVDAQQLVLFLEVCRDDDRLCFEQLIDITATDPSKDGADLWINVSLLSLKFRHRLQIKCLLPKSAAELPSTVRVYRASQWNERECAEMFGIKFVGHPDPRNILLPDDWLGFPLRKDYEFPKEYHGISCE
jgi:NADH-quinone oxidoreductase subunit C